MEFASKITIGSINGVRKGFKKVSERMHVARIAGIARTCEFKPSENMGDSYKFVGEFQGVNAKGETVAAPVCYLPEPAQTKLKNAMGNGAVEFGFDFFVVPRPETPAGYAYEIAELMEARPSEALARLLGSFPALPEKAADPAPAEPKAKAKAK